MRKYILLLFLFGYFQSFAQDEVFYHVFQRSFFDSNNDGNGDIVGINQKLDYLQDFGVTTILLTPLYVSDFYHNYFADDFENIDPSYGTMSDYTALVKEVHRRKMKIYQDVEMQYVSGKHPWFTDSYQNPKSEYSNYLLYSDDSNNKPVWFLNAPEFTIYDNTKHQIIVVNMKSDAVKDYTLKLLKFWADPNKDGKFDDGVDGFRLDHMMDNLDNANILPNLFQEFWTPLLIDLKKVNPKLKIVAEQANWNSFGHEYFEKAAVDYVFAFRLKFAINSFNKEEIKKAADSTFNFNPAGKNQIVFLENHDTKRFASEKDMSFGKLKAAAGIQLLIGGIPSIYYGQEIGMKGEQKQFGMTDGNDIPVREAFDWYTLADGKGMAHWYKNSGPWWDERTEMPNDGISLEEQKGDKNSLYNFYRDLMRLRKNHPELINGNYKIAENENANVFSFFRGSSGKNYVVMVNLSDVKQQFSLKDSVSQLKSVYGNAEIAIKNKTVSGSLSPYQVAVIIVD